MIKDCFGVSDFAIKMFTAYGIEAWRHSNSLTIVFKRPGHALIEKWQLALEVKRLILSPCLT